MASALDGRWCAEVALRDIGCDAGSEAGGRSTGQIGGGMEWLRDCPPVVGRRVIEVLVVS